jgi:hypothetical protein
LIRGISSSGLYTQFYKFFTNLHREGAQISHKDLAAGIESGFPGHMASQTRRFEIGVQTETFEFRHGLERRHWDADRRGSRGMRFIRVKATVATTATTEGARMNSSAANTPLILRQCT